MKLNCIRCRNPYESKEEDAYLCEACNSARLALAAEIDRKVGSTVGQQPNRAWDRIQELKQKSGVRRGGIAFINAKDL